MDVVDIEGGEEMLAALPEGGGGGDQAQVELSLCHHAVTWQSHKPSLSTVMQLTSGTNKLKLPPPDKCHQLSKSTVNWQVSPTMLFYCQLTNVTNQVIVLSTDKCHQPS